MPWPVTRRSRSSAGHPCNGVADTITARLDSHEKAILDLQRWRDEAAGAIRLARWALGASLLASALMVLQIAALISHADTPAVP